jgi:hypothetical protein
MLCEVCALFKDTSLGLGYLKPLLYSYVQASLRGRLGDPQLRVICRKKFSSETDSTFKELPSHSVTNSYF